MATHVALLRAVNVGGVKVAMADLRGLAVDLGWTDVQTHLNSGNLLFSSADQPAAATKRLEAVLAERYGREVPVMMRTPRELADVLERQPFRGEHHDEGRLHVAFLSATASSDAEVGGPDGEECVVHGREAFLHYPNGVGRSKLTTAALEKALGVTATVRGIRTVAGLIQRAG